MDKSKISYHNGATEHIFNNARELRRSSTLAEKLLWECLRNRYYRRLKFRRQHPISNYIVDFYCHEAKLVIELDGEIHLLDEVKEYDIRRENAIKDMGIHIMRFTNEEVYGDIDYVIERIEDYLEQIKPSPLIPLPEGEGNNLQNKLKDLPEGEGNQKSLSPSASLPEGEGDNLFIN